MDNNSLTQLLHQQQAWAQQLLESQQEFFSRFMNNASSEKKNIIPPFPKFSMETENFKVYSCQLKEHFKAYGIQDDEQKRSYFISWSGTELFELVGKLFSKEGVETRSFEEIISKLDQYFSSKVHILAARFKFHNRTMQEGESYSKWLLELKGLSRNCSFVCKNCQSDYVDEMIRDTMVLKTPHEAVRSAALQKQNPSLEEIIAISETYESTQNTLQTLRNPVTPQEVNAVKVHQKFGKSLGKSSSVQQQNQGGSNNQQQDQLPSCPGCFKNHTKQECKFRKAKCHKCGKTGHISQVCRSKNINQVDSLEEMNLASEHCHQIRELLVRRDKKLVVNVEVNEHKIEFQFDTGASCSMIDLKSYHHFQNLALEKTNTILKAYGNQNIPVLGALDVTVKLGNESKRLKLLVANTYDGSNIFGLDWYDSFNEIRDIFHINELQVQDICGKFPKLFSDSLGCCNAFQAHLYLKENATPKFFKARPIPFALQEPFKLEAKRLEELGIWKPVAYSAWASPIVIVPKPNSKIRICADFKQTINPQLDMEQYPIPRLQELLYKLQGGQTFSKIDLSDAYFQIAMDEESKKILVVNTPMGLFEYQKLPFGVSSAPAIFQRFLQQLIADIPYAVNYLDDIVVTGRTNEEHKHNLEKLLYKLEEARLTCNLSKCSFMQERIEYLGNIISKSGIEPSDKGLKAIQNMPRPKNLHDLQAFLGKVTYYIKYINNFSTLCEPLNELRRKNKPFLWGRAQEEAFQNLKQQLMSRTMLRHFDDNLPLILATDASSFGLGAVISHVYPDGSEKPIAYASKTLNVHQKHYSQIEKEGLAIIFGIKKFHEYLYGRKFILVTDHKPLVAIFDPQKAIPTHTAHRLQRWALFLSGYSFEIKYKSTSSHQNADALSRLPCAGDNDFDEESIQVDVNLAEEVASFPVDAVQIADCTKKDKVLAKVLEFVTDGWPSNIENDFKPYFNRRDSLTTINGVILVQTDCNRVVIPKCYQPKVLNLLHEGHWGVVKTKQLARRYCWWPGIDKAIEMLVAKCSSCALESSMPPKEFNSWQPPSGPWQRIHIDFAGPFQKASWFICVDSFSHYPYVIKMGSTTASATIKTLTTIFATEGLPEVIVSDNGPQFTAEEFKEFCASNGVKHLTTAPFHPASNGQAERFVRSFKTSLKKHLHSGMNVEDSLLSFLSTYRSTPLETGSSPAELLHGRQPRTMLSLLTPKVTVNYPDHSKYMVNDLVIARMYGKSKKWVNAKIVKVLGNMLYLLDTRDYGKIKRHQNQLRKSSKDISHSPATDNRLNEGQGFIPEFTHTETSIVPAYSSPETNYLPETSNPISPAMSNHHRALLPPGTPQSRSPATPNPHSPVTADQQIALPPSTGSPNPFPINVPSPRIIRRSARIKRRREIYSPEVFKKLPRRN